MLQSSRDNLLEEYADLYDSHQTMSITLEDAERRQEEDSKLITSKTRQLHDLELLNRKIRLRIQDMEFALADAQVCGSDRPASLRVTVDSVLWWKERCRACQVEKKDLEARLALLSNEACPMLCERMHTHSMECCGSKICGTCLERWRSEGGSCPYCRASPMAARPVNRPGCALNPIDLE